MTTFDLIDFWDQLPGIEKRTDDDADYSLSAELFPEIADNGLTVVSAEAINIESRGNVPAVNPPTVGAVTVTSPKVTFSIVDGDDGEDYYIWCLATFSDSLPTVRRLEGVLYVRDPKS